MSKHYAVRRLTPTECGRLQGLPDGWLDIGEWTDSKGKVHKDSDTPKYKAAGNGIATPFWYHLLKAINEELGEDEPHTMGSLFDGIGSFPLIWTHITGSADNVLWNSEIEEYPEAVTTKHFGDPDKGIVGDVEKYIVRG